MKTLLASLIYCWCASEIFATEAWKPHDRFLDAVCQVESSGGVLTSGDRGMSLGHFQIQKGAWMDVSEWRKRRNLPVHKYQQNVLNPEISRTYASNYLTILYGQLRQEYKREPTPPEIYAAYNMGLTNFRRCNFNLSKVNSITEEKCKQVAALME
ncbi:MAG: transglycosylase SLT domain-containing protein [Verrucomicrobiota bacterium]